MVIPILTFVKSLIYSGRVMAMDLRRWRRFLQVDEAICQTLREFRVILQPEIDGVLDEFYKRIARNSETSNLFRDEEVMARARRMQRRHWLDHVFSGNFNDDYVNAVRAIGATHHRVGLDLTIFVGAYCLVLNEMLDLVKRSCPNEPNKRRRFVRAINKAVFLDMGLASSVYYESYMQELQDLSRELTVSLARAGEYRDNETGLHVLRMARMCEALALEIGESSEWATSIRLASPLHDLGKIGVPDAILLKPGRLLPDEMDVMRGHPEIGGAIIPDHSAEVIRMAKRIALTHHERWDGDGYPAGLKGTEIPLEGRIAALCDVYDALVSTRPYKEAWSQDRVVEHFLANRGKHFDPHLVDAFLRILPAINAIQIELSDAVAEPSPPQESAWDMELVPTA